VITEGIVAQMSFRNKVLRPIDFEAALRYYIKIDALPGVF
jgi:hypothetical protein